MKSRAYLIAKAAITLGALIWLLLRVHPELILSTLADLSPWKLTAAIFITFFQPLFAAFRWQLIMRYLDLRLRFLDTIMIFWIGSFFAAVTPGGLAGDVMRFWTMRRVGLPISRLVNSIVLDRVIALTSLVLLVAVSLPFFDEQVYDSSFRYLIAGFLIITVLAVFLTGCLIRVGSAHMYRALRAFFYLAADLRRICVPLSRAAAVTGVGLATMFVDCFKIFLLMISVNANVSIADSMVLSPLVILALALPISIGGWGVREGVMVGLFATIGVPGVLSLSASILLGLLSLVATLPGFGFALLWKHSPVMIGRAKLDSIGKSGDKEVSRDV